MVNKILDLPEAAVPFRCAPGIAFAMCKIGRLVCIGDGADTGAASRPEGRFLLKLFSVRATPMEVGLVKVDLGLRVPSKPEWHH